MTENGTVSADDSLFAIAGEYAQLIDELVESGGDITDEQLAARLAAVQEAFPAKVERLQMVFRHLTGKADGIESFVTPYVARAKALKSAAERVKRAVFNAMVTAQQDRVETPMGGARLQNNPPSVKCDVNPADLPPEFRRVSVTLNAEKVLEVAKAGQPLPSGLTVVRGQHLRWL